jgi:hypothetical protein
MHLSVIVLSAGGVQAKIGTAILASSIFIGPYLIAGAGLPFLAVGYVWCVLASKAAPRSQCPATRMGAEAAKTMLLL